MNATIRQSQSRTNHGSYTSITKYPQGLEPEASGMKDTIRWSASSLAIRLAVVELCGWATKNGQATATGKRIAKTAWAELTPAARNVLINHGIDA